jgi:hypothetical protein
VRTKDFSADVDGHERSARDIDGIITRSVLEDVLPEVGGRYATEPRRKRHDVDHQIETQHVITPWNAQRDYLMWVIGSTAAVLSVTAFIVTVRLHAVLLYMDSISHMEIARRVVDGTSSGLAQLGGVWLPLQHILMMVFIWDDAFYKSGFAGSAVSMCAYVATTVLIYKIVTRLTVQPVAGLVAAAVFALNPNMLYMQSTPMTEPLLYCMTAGLIYCVQQWANTDRYQYLMGGAVFALLGTLTRYETWPIAACMLLAVAFIAWCRPSDGLEARIRRAGVRDRLTAFSVVAFAGIAGWVIWNWILFGNPLFFQNGPYAKPSLWITAEDIGLGSWSIATKTFVYAMRAVESWPLVALAVVGLVAMLAIEWRNKRTLGRSLPVLSVLIMIPFFIASIYTGQRPLYVLPLYAKYYNIRFALIMLMPTAILIGYLVGALKRWRPAMLTAAGLILVITVSIDFGLVYYKNVVTYNEATTYNEANRQPALLQLQYERDTVAYLQSHYAGGRVLMQDFGNELIAFQLPSSELIYEGTNGKWMPALRDPVTSHIKWIIEWCGSQPDQVCRSEGRAQLSGYDLVYRSPGANYRVYELRS